jgi:SAM-dependent methyltransferase
VTLSDKAGETIYSLVAHPVTGRVRIYSDLAPWFHLLTHPSDYAEEASFYAAVIEETSDGQAHTLLELGSGGGNNASHLKARFTCTLTDLSAEMLELSRTINSECEHVQGDMRTLRLGRTFDAVFVHDSVMYITTENDLHAVVETASAHVRPGGAVLLVPDVVRETFEPGPYGGHDGGDGRLCAISSGHTTLIRKTPPSRSTSR